MVAVGRPMHGDGRRESIPRNLGRPAERIPLALNDQRRTGEGSEMARAKLLGSLRRVKRVSERDEPRDPPRVEQRLRSETRNPPAERLAADQKPSAAHRRERALDCGRVLSDERLGLWRRAPRALKPRRHVAEIEAPDAEACVREERGNPLHPGTCHRRAGARGQQQRRLGPHRPHGKKSRHRRFVYLWTRFVGDRAARSQFDPAPR